MHLLNCCLETEAEYIGVDYLDEYSDRLESVTNESVKQRQRKVVSRIKSGELNLLCEWRDCSFTGTASKSIYFQHLTNHEDETKGLKKMFLRMISIVHFVSNTLSSQFPLVFTIKGSSFYAFVFHFRTLQMSMGKL